MLEKVTLFLGLVVPLTLSPGPVNIVLAGMGASVGIRRAIPFLLGLTLSAILIAGAGGFGLTLVFQTNASVYAIVKYTGIAYIAYLGVKFILSPAPKGDDSPGGMERKPIAGFIEGMLLTVLNPKFYIMVTVIFAQFVTPQGGVALVAGAFILVLFLSQTFWLAAGGAAGRLFDDERSRRWQKIVFGILLLTVSVFIAFSP